MSAKGRNLARVGLAAAFLCAAVLACGPGASGGAVAVAINGPTSGSAVTVGQEVLVDSTATANAGVDRVELAVNGAVVRRDSPPEGNPTTFRVSQPWVPEAEGQATISVVAFDVNGNSSDSATITLQVVASGAAAPTSEPGAPTAEPEGPTETPPPPVTTEAGCSLDSSYVADVTIPDGTEMSPGAAFVKTWKVRNSGTCDWDAGFDLIFVGGAQMSGPASVALPAVSAGDQTDISVNLTAPSSYGTHKGTWRIRADDGTVFGTNLTVLIEVPAPATDTPPPTNTPLPTDVPTEVPTDVPTDTPVPTLLPPVSAPYTQEVVAQSSIAAGDTGSASVSCPAESVVVGGGYASSVDMLVYNHAMSGNGWQAYAKNNAGSSKLLNVYAVCLFNAPGATTERVLQQVTAPAGDKGHPVAACPAGSIVTGGGWAGRSDGSLQIYNSSQSGNGWQVWADNVSGSDKPVNAYAVCLSGFSGTTSQVLESATIAGGGNEGIVATCSGGALATGGGFAAQDDLVMKTSHQNSDSTWITYGTNVGSSDRTIFSYVTCLTSP